jgi:hypothetical protein
MACTLRPDGVFLGLAKRILKVSMPQRSWCLLFLQAAVAACAMAQATGSVPAVDTITGLMVQARAENRAHLRSYQVTRNYKLFLGNDTQKIKSEVIADVTFVPPRSKKFVIGETSGGLGETIVRQMLASEAELLKNQTATDISPANYDFRFINQQDLDHQRCFVLELLPRRKDRNLLQGTVWIDSVTYLIRRIEGEPAKSPSMWLHNVHIALGYGDVSGMWLQTMSESTADVLLLGSHRMISRDTGYQITKDTAAIENSNAPVSFPAGGKPTGVIRYDQRASAASSAFVRLRL